MGGCKVPGCHVVDVISQHGVGLAGTRPRKPPTVQAQNMGMDSIHG